MIFGGPPSIIGIDIGTGSIKAVQVKKGPSGPQLTNFTIAPLAEGAIVDGQITDSVTVTEAIKEVMSSISKKGSDIYISISGQNVIARFIPMPFLSDDDLANSIKYEAEQYVPYAIDDVSISFSKLAEIENEGAKQLYVLLVVAQKELIGSFMGTLQGANISPAVMDVDCFAVLNALSESIPDEGVISVIDIGSGITSINIIKEGVLQFTRNIPIAGNNITMVIQNVLKLDFEQAENVKTEEGIAVMDDEENEVSEVIRTIIEELTSEIRRSFDFYKAQHRVGAIDKILLSGGTSKLKNLDVFMANELGIEVELGDPLVGINVEIPEQELLYENVLELTVALGLAVRGVME